MLSDCTSWLRAWWPTPSDCAQKAPMMIRLSIMHFDMYPILKRQMRNNQKIKAAPKLAVQQKASRIKVKPKPATRRRSQAGSEPTLTANQPAWTQLSKYKRWCAAHHWFCIAVYLTELVRYVVIALISVEYLFNYHQLDCFLVGRFRFIGRTNRISTRVLMIFLLVYLGHRIILFMFTPKQFKFYAVEFLLYTYQEILENEVRATKSGQHGDSGQQLSSAGKGALASESMLNSHDAIRPETDDFNKQSRDSSKVTAGFGRPRPNPALFLRSPFYPNRSIWILRPNRTSEGWRLLYLFSTVAGCVYAIFFVLWFAVLYYSMAGALLTNLGYEMAYPSCVEWIQRHQRAHQRARNGSSLPGGQIPYAHIYLAPDRLAHQTNIDALPARIPVLSENLPTLTAYNFLRISVDLLENHFWYLEFTAFFIIESYLLMLASVDIIINAAAIRRRLEQLVVNLSEAHRTKLITKNFVRTLYRASGDLDHHEHRQDNSGDPLEIHSKSGSTEETDDDGGEDDQRDDQGGSGKSLSPAENGSRSVSRMRECNPIHTGTESQVDLMRQQQLDETISNLQSILVDHFLMVRNYNNFVTFQLGAVALCWFSYTLVLINWLGNTRSRTMEFEFTVTEIGGTCFSIVFFSSAAVARSLNFHLYELISRAVALDSGDRVTRLRWTSIMEFYTPKPMYCFSLNGISEISWLFCLKFASWIVSAFVVLANFYYHSRM